MYHGPVATHLCTDVCFLQHVPPGEHPERPERLSAIEEALLAARLPCRPLAARPATAEEILRVHDRAYLDDLERRMGPGYERASGWLDPDTYYGPGSYSAALHAAGAAVELARTVLSSAADNGLALVRPPGHHATRSRAMGFCLINNVAVAAAAARAAGARVAIVDIDVHHGNGTEEIFAADPDVLFVSTHQWPLYPGTGEATFTGTGLGQGATLNLPLPQGSGDAVYRRCFGRVVLPALRRFQPDLLLVSAGFDGHRSDPLAGMELSEAGYAWMFAQLLQVQPRLGAVLEGGYHLRALSQSVVAVLQTLLSGRGPALPDEPIPPEAEAVISQVRQIHHL
jgi:acetoin utilization deacetylase AcuC-like enzyme